MMRQLIKSHDKHFRFPLTFVFIAALFLIACQSNGHLGKKVKLDPKNPVTISVWHYYNGYLMNVFEDMITEFNETIGQEEGILVESYGHGNVAELEKAVTSSAKKEVGSMDMPNIFASYADTAYEAEAMDILANLDDYLTKEEQEEYQDTYMEEGRIGLNGELRIFPIAKSTEVFLLNDTDWQPFARANDLTYEDLATLEDVTRVSELYYNWTDSLTPNVPNDGKAFFGRDSMANLFIITSKGFGTEMFQVDQGKAEIEINKEAMRKIWDHYYVPYISGFFTSYGRFRSDDAKVGDVIAYVGSTSSASYFPSEVTINDETHPIEAKVLPAPHFKDSDKVMVQQGAGMAVTKSTPGEEYASIVFLKWFTDTENNIAFSSLSGYLPVKKEANDYDELSVNLSGNDPIPDDITIETLQVALNEMKSSQLYTNKAFDGGAEARGLLERHLQDKADTDRDSVLKSIKSGESLEQAVAKFDTEERFNDWLQELTDQLNELL